MFQINFRDSPNLSTWSILRCGCPTTPVPTPVLPERSSVAQPMETLRTQPFPSPSPRQDAAAGLSEEARIGIYLSIAAGCVSFLLGMVKLLLIRQKNKLRANFTDFIEGGEGGRKGGKRVGKKVRKEREGESGDEAFEMSSTAPTEELVAISSAIPSDSSARGKGGEIADLNPFRIG